MRTRAVLQGLTFAASLCLALPALALDGTLKKIKDSGAATMGVRESSGGLSFTLGDGKFAGFHVELCPRPLPDVQKHLGLHKLDINYTPVNSHNLIPTVQKRTAKH